MGQNGSIEIVEVRWQRKHFLVDSGTIIANGIRSGKNIGERPSVNIRRTRSHGRQTVGFTWKYASPRFGKRGYHEFGGRLRRSKTILARVPAFLCDETADALSGIAPVFEAGEGEGERAKILCRCYTDKGLPCFRSVVTVGIVGGT